MAVIDPRGIQIRDPQLRRHSLPMGGRWAGGARPPNRAPKQRPPQRPPQSRRKKLQVMVCVLLVELCERFTFFGIVCNMILFCTVKLGYDNYQAATANLAFVGVCTLTPVLVGWFAETCLGRTKVLCLCTLLHFFGMYHGPFTRASPQTGHTECYSTTESTFTVSDQLQLSKYT